jgi:toxin ParE1/3/4
MAVADYQENAGPRVALSLVEELERAFARIASYPAAGSPRFAYELGIPDLRHVRVKGFPYLIFYIELAAHIDVWRVLHAKRDIPAWLEDRDIEEH